MAGETKEPQAYREFKRVKAKREKWDATLDKCGRYALPGSAGLATTTDTDSSRGEARGADVYDTTGAEALEDRAAIIHGTMFPPQQDWMECEHRIIDGLSDTQKQTLEEHQKGAAKKFMRAIRYSNFDMELPQSLQEALISTSAIILHMQPRGSKSPFRFEVIPLRRLCVEEGLSGRLTRVFMPRNVRVEDIKTKWPEAKFNDDLEKLLKDAPDKEITVHDCFMPDGEGDRGSIYEVWWFNGSGSGGYHRLVETKYEVSPVIAYRFAKDAGEDMGRGPVLKAAPGMYTANTAKELVLQDAALQIEGVWNLVVNGQDTYDVQKIEPGIVIQTSQPGHGLQRVDLGGRIDIADYVIKDAQESIANMIKGADLPAADDGVRTAYEYAVRKQHSARIEIPTTLRLIVELVMPLGERGLHILQSLEWRGDPTYGIKPITIDGVQDASSLMPSMRNPIMKLYDQAKAAGLISAVAEAVQIFGPERVAGAIQMNATLRKILTLRDFPMEHLQDEEFITQLDQAERDQIVAMLAQLAQQTAGVAPGGGVAALPGQQAPAA